MTELERRKKIGMDLVARLDEYFPTRERRRLYGRKGRDLGEDWDRGENYEENGEGVETRDQ